MQFIRFIVCIKLCILLKLMSVCDVYIYICTQIDCISMHVCCEYQIRTYKLAMLCLFQKENVLELQNKMNIIMTCFSKSNFCMCTNVPTWFMLTHFERFACPLYFWYLTATPFLLTLLSFDFEPTCLLCLLFSVRSSDC